MEQQQIIDGLKTKLYIYLGIICVFIVAAIIAFYLFIGFISGLKKESENTKTELENTIIELKTELKNRKRELEDKKKELEKTTSFLTVVYLSFAAISAMLNNQNLIRNEKNQTFPLIVEEIGKFRKKYIPEKFGDSGDFRKFDSEFKTKLDQLTSLNINSIDLAYK